MMEKDNRKRKAYANVNADVDDDDDDVAVNTSRPPVLAVHDAEQDSDEDQYR